MRSKKATPVLSVSADIVRDSSEYCRRIPQAWKGGQGPLRQPVGKLPGAESLLPDCDRRFGLRQNSKANGFSGGSELAAQCLFEGDSGFLFWLLTPDFSNSRALDDTSNSTSLSCARGFQGAQPHKR